MGYPCLGRARGISEIIGLPPEAGLDCRARDGWPVCGQGDGADRSRGAPRAGSAPPPFLRSASSHPRAPHHVPQNAVGPTPGPTL